MIKMLEKPNRGGQSVLRLISVILLIGIMIVSIIPFSIIQSNAASTFTKISTSTRIDSKYSFSPRWISGKTYLEPFGNTASYSYAADLWKLEGGGSKYSTMEANWYYPIRLTSASQKGKMGVWYRNVGEYQGKMLDMKYTIVDWTQIRGATTLTSSAIPGGSKVSYTTIFFDKTGINLYTVSGYMKQPKFRIEFFDHTTGQPVAVSGHNTFKDIDDAQFYIASTDVRGYLASNTVLTASGNRVQSPSGGAGENDKPNWLTITYDNKTAIDFVFNNNLSENENFTTVKRKTRGPMVIIFDGDSLAPFTTPSPIKSGTTSATPNQAVSYNIAFTVPQQPTGYLYSKFVLSDTLPSGLKYTGFSVKNDAGSNVTSSFTGSINGQEFTLTPNNLSSSSFYFKGYTVTINATVEDKDYKDQQGSDGRVILKNQAKITAKNSPSVPEETKTSNVINTEVLFNINTKTDGNGSITDSIKGISAGSTKEITFTPNAGYEVDTVTVDGTQVTATDKYVFSDISKNHEISVTFKPVYRQLGIAKIIDPKDVNISYGRPTAIFKVEGTDVTGQKHEYEYVIPLRFVSEGSGTPYDGMYAGIITDTYRKVPEVPAGTYTITEVKTSHYDVESVYAEGGKVTSDNTVMLNVEQVKEKLLSLPYVRNELNV